MTQQADRPVVTPFPFAETVLDAPAGTAGTGTAGTDPRGPWPAAGSIPAPRAAYPAPAPMAPPAAPMGYGPPPVAAPPVGPAGLGGMAAPAAPSGAGRTAAMIIGAIGAVVVALVLVLGLIGALAGGGSTDTTASPAPAPTVSAPSAPSGSSSGTSSGSSSAAGSGATDPATERAFNEAGARIDAARDTFGTAMRDAISRKDLAAFRSAARTFSAELATYRSTVTSLPIPAAQKAAVTQTLAPEVDATIAACDDMASAGSSSELQTAATRFDEHWKAVAAAHNAVNDSLHT